MSSSESIPNLVGHHEDSEDDGDFGDDEILENDETGYELLKKLMNLFKFLCNEDAYENIEKDADIEMVLNIAAIAKEIMPDKNLVFHDDDDTEVTGLWKSNPEVNLQLSEILGDYSDSFDKYLTTTLLSVKVLNLVGMYVEKKSCRRIYQIMVKGKLSDIKNLPIDLMTITKIRDIRILNITPSSPKTLINNILKREPEMGNSTNICYAHAIATGQL